MINTPTHPKVQSNFFRASTASIKCTSGGRFDFDLHFSFFSPQLLCLIGEAFDDHSEDICGAVVNVRPKGDKIGIWTADASRSKSDGILSIGWVAMFRAKEWTATEWYGFAS